MPALNDDVNHAPPPDVLLKCASHNVSWNAEPVLSWSVDSILKLSIEPLDCIPLPLAKNVHLNKCCPVSLAVNFIDGV